MMPSCAALNCTNRKKTGSGKSFHVFPRSKPDLVKKWLINMKRDKFYPSKSTFLCSDHFEEHCFDRTGQTIRLREGAAPTLFQFTKRLIKPVRRKDKASGKTWEPKHDSRMSSKHFHGGKLPQEFPGPCRESGDRAASRLRPDTPPQPCLEECQGEVFVPVISALLDHDYTGAPPSVLRHPPMESAEAQLSPFRKSPPSPAHSQLCEEGRRETCTDSGGGTSGCVEHVNLRTHQKTIKKEETEDEGCCEGSSGAVDEVTPVTEEKPVIKEEPEDDYLCEGTSSPADEQNEELNILLVKEEESEDEGSVCMTTVCELDDDDLQVFSCFWCSLSYTSQAELEKHIRTKHKEEYEKVVISGEFPFENVIILTRSSGIQTKSPGSGTRSDSHGQVQKVYHCSQCGNGFTNRSNLKVHQRIHTGRKPYQCSQCGKTFTRQSSLQQHHVVHTGEKPYECSQCGKTFTRQSSLQQHRRLHTGEKPHRCSECGKSFPRQSDLQKHQRVHTGEKPYQCSQCGKSFSQKCNLRTHRQIHTEEKPYHCSHCGKRFAWQSTFHTHQRIHARKATSLLPV